jgi:hypothetical protein
MWIQSEGDNPCSLATLRVPGVCGTYSDIWFMNSFHDLESVLWRPTVFTGNITYSGPMWVSVHNMIHECSMWIQSDEGKLCSLVTTFSAPMSFSVQDIILEYYSRSGFSLKGTKLFNGTLRVPEIRVSYSDICFMNNLQDLGSVWWRQTVFTGNITCSGPMWSQYRIWFMNSMQNVNSVQRRPSVFTDNISFSGQWWSQSSINFMKFIQDHYSIWIRQRVFTGILLFPVL